jgi:aldose 1-epimerase
MSVQIETAGEVEGGPLLQATLRNAAGGAATILNYGAILHSWTAPGGDGAPVELTVGAARPDEYGRANPAYFGAVCGRVANRIARGRFTLDGVSYTLACNNGPNHLHGGVRGFDRRVWTLEADGGRNESVVRLRLHSPDGEEGYPGALEIEVVYTLTDDHRLRIDYTAHADAPTPVNLTQHTYFHLSGGHAPDILGHRLTLRAGRYLPTDADDLVTGEMLPVDGTPFDFRAGAALDGATRGRPEGYDHCFVLDARGADEPCARLEDPVSGRTLEMRTTEPGLHVYTGAHLAGVPGRDGAPLPRHAGIALEAEHFPDAVNQAAFPSVILRPGEAYRQTTEYRVRLGP